MTLGNGKTCKDYPSGCGNCGGMGAHYQDCPHSSGYYIENMTAFKASYNNKPTGEKQA